MTRATLCELLATRILRKFSESHPTRHGLLLLANILVAGFEPFQNCPEEVLEDNRNLIRRSRMVEERGLNEKMTNALEVAIISESKGFISSTACQRVVEAVHWGRIVYTPNSFIDIIPDHYKRKAVTLYDPRKAPLLNQYRLIVPRTRGILETGHFVILLALYTATMVNRNNTTITGWEWAFIVYAAGWILDEIASMLEHGWHVHTQNLWSFLDITFIVIYVLYLILRVHSWVVDDIEIGTQALDVLACAAPIIFPRIAFNVMPENMLFISLRAMMTDFIVLTGLAVWCFGGFLLAMAWLSRWRAMDDEPIASVTISKWMLWIWFGLDGTGIQRSIDFHLILGPILMVTFAFLGNTLFLTILVSMLTNTFSKIAVNATEEIQFRRAVLTFEGVKSDAIFAYRPPFNILAVLILVPLRFVLTPRYFHKVHVFAARVLNAPILLLIASYERHRLWQQPRRGRHARALKRSASSLLDFSGFSVHRDLQDVFEYEPPQDMIDEIEEEDVLDDDMLAVGLGAGRNRSVSPGNIEGTSVSRRRRLSSTVPRRG
jgi:hypothetical protein